MIGGEPGRERTYRVIELLAAGSVSGSGSPMPIWWRRPGCSRRCVTRRRDGVDVRLLVPGSSDLPLVRNLSRIGYRDLLRSGVRIYEWEGPMLHAKTIVADGRWVRVGSSNLNASSLIGNYELDVLIEDARPGRGHGAPVPARHRPEPGGDPPPAAGAAAHQLRRCRPRSDHREPEIVGTQLPPARGESVGNGGRRWRSGSSLRTRGDRSSCRSAACWSSLGVLFFVLPAHGVRVRGVVRVAGDRSAGGRRSGGAPIAER